MEYIGNFADYIPKNLTTALLKNTHSKQTFSKEDLSLPETQVWLKAGYDLEKISFYSFDNKKYKQIIKLPEFFGEILEIWFTRLDPGDMFPLHQDIYTEYDDDNLERYCIMLQDYQPGHVFLYENVFLKDYKFGDAYQFNHSFIWHGACNIGLVPRLTMQIVSNKS